MLKFAVNLKNQKKKAMKKIIRKIMLMMMLIGFGTAYLASGQQLFYEGFEHNGAFPSDWTLVPGTGDDWVIDDGTTHGPGAPHSGSYTAMFNDYDYSSGTTAEMITPRIDLSSTTQGDSIVLSFWYWDGGGNDVVEVLASTDGQNYTSIYTTPSTVDPWAEQFVDLSNYAGEDTLYISFKGTSTWGYNNPNVDDVSIFKVPPVDLSVSYLNVIQENTCAPSNDTILVTVKNKGAQPQVNYVVSYSLDSSTWVSQTITDTLNPGDVKDVAFAYAFTNFGNYTIYAKVEDAAGADTLFVDNNYTNISITKQPVIDSFPYTQDFEGSQYWVSGGTNSSWQLGTPAGPVINSAASGSNAWVTNLTGDYNANEYSYVESPCFDFSNLHNPLVQFKYWVEAESGTWSYDGALLEYSVDSGATWNIIGNVGDWMNWYNKSNISALSSDGWSGYNGNGTNGWIEARHLLNNLAGQPHVKFRFVFASDYAAQYDGFAFDDFTIREGDINLAITEINYNGPEGGADTTEFIEWYNYGQDAVNVNGFYYSQGVTDTLPDLTVLPGGYFVSAIDSSVMANFFHYNGAIQWDNGGLSNSGEDIALHTWWGETVDSVFYDDGNGWPTAPDGHGPSLVFCNQNIGLDQNDPSNWTVSTSFVDSINGTAVYASPGAMDSSCMFVDLLVVMPEDSAHYYDCDLSATDTVDIMFTNIGNMDVPAGDTIYFAYQVNSGTWVEDTLVAQANIAAGDTLPFTFDQTVDFSALGDYNYRVYVSYSNDNNQMNDTVSGILTHYEPVVDLGPDTIWTTQPDTIVLDAGAGFDTYVWNDGSTNQTLAVTCADTCMYYVTAMDSNGCSASDTIVIVKQLVYDIAVTEPANGEHYSTCNIGVDTVDIKVENVGGMTIPAGDTIIAGYQINGGSWVVDTFQLQNDLVVDSSVSLVFSEPYDFTAVGDYDFAVFATYANDTINDNDTAVGVLTHYELSVDLGPDTIWTTQPDTIVLDAGAGFDTYLWNDSSTNQTLTVTGYGTYYVMVSDTNGCTASDTVVVQMATVNNFASLGNVVIYPNPSHGEFNVEVPAALVGNALMYVTDITGKVIYRQNVTSTNVKVNINGYSEGIYFVKLVSGDATEVYKVIVK